MSDQIELHDSRVTMKQHDRTVVLRLCPAYVHHWEQVGGAWIGERGHQTEQIALSDGMVAPKVEGPSDVSDGWVEVGSRRYQNMLPVPFSATVDALEVLWNLSMHRRLSS